MITIKDFMETVNYKITEGADFMWQCFGSNAYNMSYWNGKHGSDGVSVDITFDTVNQTVYEMGAHDYQRDRSYRWTHPDYIEARNKEATSRGIDIKVAYDEVNFVELDVADDMLEKASAIVSGESYDERVSIPLQLPADTLFDLMKLAHEQDITFNQLITDVLVRVANETLEEHNA